MSAVDEIQEEIDQIEDWFKTGVIDKEKYASRMKTLQAELGEAVELRRQAEDAAAAEFAKKAAAQASLEDKAKAESEALEADNATKASKAEEAADRNRQIADAMQKVKSVTGTAEALAKASAEKVILAISEQVEAAKNTSNDKPEAAANSNKPLTTAETIKGVAGLFVVALVGYWMISGVAGWMFGGHKTETAELAIDRDTTTSSTAGDLNMLEMALSPSIGTKKMFDDLVDEGGLNKVSTFHGLRIAVVTPVYDEKNGRISFFSMDIRRTTGAKEIRQVMSSICGFTDKDWTIRNDGYQTGDAKNDNCHINYMPGSEVWWSIVFERPGAYSKS